MSKWIRWQGLVPFLIITAAIAAFWLLFLDPMAKWAVERAGTAIVGAKVDLDKADVTLSPLGVTLRRLQVTDPGSPLKNAVEVKRIAFSLDGMNLLRRKVIITEMAAEGIRLNTDRKRSGAVIRPPKKKEPRPGKTLALPSFEVPDAKTVLDKEQLESLKLIEEVRKDLQGAEGSWKKRTEGLPDKEKIAAYRKRIEALKQAKKGGAQALLGSAADASALVKDLRSDINRVRTAQDALNAELATWKQRIGRAEKAPAEEAKRLRNKYGFSTDGLKNMSSMLFGEKISGWVETGFLWYDRLQPLMERSSQKHGKAVAVKPLRGKGVDIRFREDRPLPGFLITSIKASALPASGVFDGVIRNVTPDQNILGKPLTFSFSGQGMQNLAAASMEGALDHVVPARSDDRMTLQVRKYRMGEVVLSKSDRLSVVMKQALADYRLDSRLQNGRISAKLTATVHNAVLDTGGTRGDSPVIASIAKALSQVNGFTVTALVSGTRDDYDLSISSDLDRVLQQAVGSFLRDQGEALEKKLQAMLAEKTSGRIRELKDGLGPLQAVSSDLSSRSDVLNSLLSEATRSGRTGGIKLPF